MLNFPNANLSVTGNRTRLNSAGGQSLFIDTLLPIDAKLKVTQLDAFEPDEGMDPANPAPAANGESTNYRRLVVESSNQPKPQGERFLHVLKGNDTVTTAFASTDASFTGVKVDG
ncbi:MAG: hypothetical protein R2880_13360 [Deinococcales bacterium]